MARPIQLLLSERELQALKDFINDSTTDDPRFNSSPVLRSSKPLPRENFKYATVRAASRVYFITSGALKTIDMIMTRISARRAARTGKPVPARQIVPAGNRLALSLATLLFFHRFLYRFFGMIRRELSTEENQRARTVWPKVYQLLTSRYTPAIAASLSGLALGIYPKSQLRLTIVIFVLTRALELSYTAADYAGYMTRKPKWMGSWILFALAQGQLLHSFVFDGDCFPDTYGDFIFKHVPEYVQKKPANLSPDVPWPTRPQIVENLAEMARLKWPPYVSPTLRPKVRNTLPSTIDPVISSITSRAEPAIQHLSCALIHPNDTSCFTPFLRQILLSFTTLGRFLTIYYAAFSLLRIRTLFKEPVKFLDRLARQILRVTLVLVGGISGSWGSICFFNNYFPKSFLPQFRFFLGGLIGGCAAILDPSPTGHENAMYAVRTSMDSLWKVGLKHRWWKEVKGGDIYVLVASMAVLNVICDIQRKGPLATHRTMMVIKLLRGDVEVGLQNRTPQKRS